jgi:hypothetical protein
MATVTGKRSPIRVLFLSLQNTSDFFFTMDNGIRMKMLSSLASGFQATTRYNNRPPAGTGDTDNLYLLTLGYVFDTCVKEDDVCNDTAPRPYIGGRLC